MRVTLDVYSGREKPTWDLTANDARRYELRASWVRSKYFYQVPELFEQPVSGDVRLDDLHDFDTTRSDGVVDLRVRVTDRFTLIAGYRLYQLNGHAVNTVFVPGADTFLVRAPLDSNTNVGRLAGEFEALGASFLVQQDYRPTGSSTRTARPTCPPAASIRPAPVGSAHRRRAVWSTPAPGRRRRRLRRVNLSALCGVHVNDKTPGNQRTPIPVVQPSNRQPPDIRA